MTQQTKQPECCGQKVAWRKNNRGIEFLCKSCGKSGSGSTTEEAVNNFNNSTANNFQVARLPVDAQNLPAWAQSHIGELMRSSATFLNEPAVQRMIDKNIQYILTADLKNAWSSQEGIRSIVEALKESFWYGAVMPDMGSIIPFGNSVEFVPALSAFDFALTTGDNAMFEWIETIPIYQNDVRDKLKQENGELIIDITPGIPRGEIIAIAVRGKDKRSGKVIGDIYDEQRLMEKAKAHSKSYQAYLKKMAEHNQKKSEGQNVGEFWMTNPYDGADKVEMLKKVAGKTFFRPYMKIRNSIEMAGAIKNISERSTEKMLDDCLNTAAAQVAPQPEPEPPVDDNIKDADFENSTIDQAEMFDPDSIEY